MTRVVFDRIQGRWYGEIKGEDGRESFNSINPSVARLPGCHKYNASRQDMDNDFIFAGLSVRLFVHLLRV